MSAPHGPRLTVGLPLYNGERYLESAAEAILSQTFEDFELLIADNASTDASAEICRGLAARDPRVRYIRHPENIGAALNHNVVVAEARGDLFRWAAHDDLLEPTCLARCVETLDEWGPDTVVAFPRTRMIDADGAHTSDWAEQGSVDQDTPDGRLRALLENPTGHLRVCSPTYGVVRTRQMRETRLMQLFDSSDVVFLVELALRGKFAEVPEYLYLRRIHPGASWGGGSSDALQRTRRMNPDFQGYPTPQLWLMKGYVEAVMQAPLTSAERRRCLAAVAAHLGRDRMARIVFGEVRRSAQARVASALRRR
ncbi:MAG: glycosyltransferase family A protein [Actinomycetota bacterium]